MTKPPFFKHPVGLTVGEIAALTGAELRNGACLDHVITNIAPLDRAGPSDLAFLDTAKYAAALTSTQAGACLMTERFESQAPSGLNVLRAQEPYRAFVDVARKLYPTPCGRLDAAVGPHPQRIRRTGCGLRPQFAVPAQSQRAGRAVLDCRPSSLFGSKGVTPGAIVHPSAQIENGVSIDPGAVIGPRAAIGAGTVIGSPTPR
jgi:UDP-3-O-[3-hydroxymyristoyl] glucosamine N-acyltransferase